jgi:hypothetical protein
MKRIFAVLAIVAVLAIPVAAQVIQGPQNGHGQCASSQSWRLCAGRPLAHLRDTRWPATAAAHRAG